MDRTLALRLVRIAASLGLHAIPNGSHVIVRIPGAAATGQLVWSNNKVRSLPELYKALGY